MANQLEFSLPNDNWEAVPSTAGQKFTAIRKGNFPRFTPNITVDSASVRPETRVSDIANSVLRELTEDYENVELVDRKVIPNEDPAQESLSQRITFDVRLDGESLQLMQVYFIYLVEELGGEHRLAMSHILTAESGDARECFDDFRAFIESCTAN